MAQPIQCDPHNGEHLADWIVVHIENGETLGYCNAAYAELMIATAGAIAQAEADQAAAEAEAKLAAAAPAHVVKRGTSSSRKAHEARKRAPRGANTGDDRVAFHPTAPAVTGPDDDEPDDADELARAAAGAAPEAGNAE